MKAFGTHKLVRKVNSYELIGIILGDGCILNYPDKGVYGLEITGNAEEELDYCEKIAEFIQCVIQKKPRVFVKNE